MINVQHFGVYIYTDFRLICLKYPNSQKFAQNCFNEMPHFIQFSVGAHEPCETHWSKYFFVLHNSGVKCSVFRWKGISSILPLLYKFYKSLPYIEANSSLFYINLVWNVQSPYKFTCFYRTRYYHTRFHMFLPYTYYHTCFHRFQIEVATIRGWNYPLAVLCQDLGLFTPLAAVLSIAEGGGGLKRWTISGFLVLLGWAPCQVGTRSVKLAGLSGKSTCNLCVAFGVQGAVLASAFLCPVCSISWMGSSREEGPFPIGELDKIDLVFVCKVGDILLVEFKVGEV